MRVGIYPGAFDPVHDGHLAFAEAAMAQFGLDKVFFLPEPKPRHKQAVKALQHREAMVQLATKPNPKLGVIRLEQARFTVQETWPLLTSRFTGAELYMLLGSDVAQRLASWPHIDELIKSAPHFVVALRGADKPHVNAMIETMQKTTKLPFKYSLLEPNYPLYSSGKIRLSLKRGHTPRSLRPAVVEYIRANNLYSSRETGEK